MSSATASGYRRSVLLGRYAQEDMYRRFKADRNRDQALCIMNFRSFSMFDQAPEMPGPERSAGPRTSQPTNHRSLTAKTKGSRKSSTKNTKKVPARISAANYSRRTSPRTMISAGRLSVMVFVILMLFTFSFIFKAFMMSGTDVHAGIPLSDIKYKVVEINYGDTLWSIARDNMNPGYDSINAYISDIMECNQMTSDHLNTGGYLMIPYYEYAGEDTL